jgi:hypothetical protein
LAGVAALLKFLQLPAFLDPSGKADAVAAAMSQAPLGSYLAILVSSSPIAVLAAKDKQDSKTREGEITAANTAIGELDTKIAKYEPSGAWDIAAATASAFPDGSKKAGNCKNFNSAATPANTWTYHRKTSGVADEAACKKRCDDFKTDEASGNGRASNHAGRDDAD